VFVQAILYLIFRLITGAPYAGCRHEGWVGNGDALPPICSNSLLPTPALAQVAAQPGRVAVLTDAWVLRDRENGITNNVVVPQILVKKSHD